MHFLGCEIVLGNSADQSGRVLSALLVHSISGVAAYCTALHTGETAVACCPLFLWWVPPLNLFLVGHVYRTAKRELQLECAKAECNVMRKESKICKTKYPILLVHGIFFGTGNFLITGDGFRQN